MLKNITIKNSITFIVGALIILLTYLSVTYMLDQKGWNWEARRMLIANELTDHVLTAASFNAVERGVTAAALASKEKAPRSTIDKISRLREKGDSAYQHVVDIGNKLIVFDPSNILFTEALGEYEDGFADLLDARRKVDASLGMAEKSYKPEGIIKVVSELSNIGADMRGDALLSPSRSESFQFPIKMNANIKSAVWLASEYAGRERAMMGGAIGSGKPIKPAVREKLREARGIVEMNIKNLEGLTHDKETDPRIISTLEKMHEVFLGDFEKLRQKVYGSEKTGEYGVTAGEWVSAATGGINTILDISKAVSLVVVEDIDAVVTRTSWGMIKAIAQLALTLALAILSVIIVRRKILAPLNNIKSVIGDLSDGDLTKRLNMNQTDEIGLMAKALDGFSDNLSNVLGGISGDAKSLTTSSGGLSNIASQLTISSENMSGEASNVSTSVKLMTENISRVQQETVTASSNVNNVSAAVEEMSQNMNHVAETSSSVAENANSIAAAIDEMSSTIREIAQNTSKASKISGKADKKSEQINTLMNSLRDSAKTVSEVVEVINDIADRTNILALNATIEAASAGDAGKGFAVVANEVKELSKQTAGATADVITQISDMQQNTEAVIAAITDISGVIQEISDINSTIAAAVEEQDATTSEVSRSTAQTVKDMNDTTRNVKEAALGSEEVARNTAALASIINEISSMIEENARQSKDISSSIESVNSDAASSVADAGNVNNNATQLSELAAKLYGVVEQFKISSEEAGSLPEQASEKKRSSITGNISMGHPAGSHA